MATAFQLIGTGIGMGFVHVLTGPDHMSALATLSSSSSSSSSTSRVSKCYLFGLGARWEIGHSIGLLLVGGIFILKDILRNDSDHSDPSDNSDRIEIPEVVTRLFESFVGIFMLLLGIYGIYEARKMKNRYSTVTIGSFTEGIGEKSADIPGADALRTRYSDDGHQGVTPFEIDENSHSDSQSDGEGPLNSEEFEDEDFEEFHHGLKSEDHYHHHHHRHHHQHHNYSSKSPLLALCAGIFHGLAGPGGVLGVVPAIQLHNAGLAACYLLSFCASSTLTMGTFAAVYGSFTKWLSRCCSKQQQITRTTNSSAAASVIVEFWVRCFSASLSLLVGVAWLVLLSMGKLEDVFG